MCIDTISTQKLDYFSIADDYDQGRSYNIVIVAKSVLPSTSS